MSATSIVNTSGSDSPRRSIPLGLLLVAALLTYIIWNFPMAPRGLWVDDVTILAIVKNRQGLWNRLVGPIVSPTRIFAGVPYTVAMFFPNPALVLQVMGGLVRLIGGLLTAVVLHRLFPGERAASYLGCCLFICSTADFLTDATMALAYEISAAFFIASFAFLLPWWRDGRVRDLIVALLLLEISVWMTDVANAPALIVPVILCVWMRPSRTRLTITFAAWYLALLPYFVILIRWLRAGQGYAGVAMIPMPLFQRFQIAFGLFVYNFTPWRWAFARNNWFPAPPRVIRVRYELLLAVVATAIFVYGYWRTANGNAGTALEKRKRRLLLCLAFLGAAFAANAAYSFVQLMRVHLRTHLLSNYFAAIAMASLATIPSGSWRRVSLLACAAFVFLGVCGGVDRQNYFSGYWRRQREELRSLVENVPGLQRPGAVILRIPPVPRLLMATEVEYLLKCWMTLLYDDYTMQYRCFLWEQGKKTVCEVDGDVIKCLRFTGEDVPIVLKNAVILDYDAAANRYDLSHSPPGGDSAFYDPKKRILPTPYSSFARHVLGLKASAVHR
jgi:hypothetical protein